MTQISKEGHFRDKGGTINVHITCPPLNRGVTAVLHCNGSVSATKQKGLPVQCEHSFAVGKCCTTGSVHLTELEDPNQVVQQGSYMLQLQYKMFIRIFVCNMVENPARKIKVSFMLSAFPLGQALVIPLTIFVYVKVADAVQCASGKESFMRGH